jgi:hypothetical protein
MDALNPDNAAAVAPALRSPRIWKFWGTTLWGLFAFGAMSVGQIAVVAYFVLRRDGPIDMAAAIHVVGGGLTLALSVIMGLPAVVLALWIGPRVRAIAARHDYLGAALDLVALLHRPRSAGRVGRGMGLVSRAGARGSAEFWAAC